MSEGEIVDAITSYYELVINLVALYITVISGFLVTVYFGGTRLTNSQILIVSILFFVMAGVCTYGAYGFLRRAFDYVDMQNAMNPSLTSYATPALAYILPTLMLGGIIAAMKFMWDARYPVLNDRSE